MSEGTIAWLLISSALVLFMTPGLALFYGGMVRSKNVLNMLMKNFFTISIVTVIWTVIGYSLAFGTDIGGFIGGFDFVGLNGVEGDAFLFMVFQMMFAIITPALITGAVAESMKFSAWVLFTSLWALIVYPIVAHWGFAAEGWLFAWGVRDFAGGLVVHINAGIAALALVFALGPRKGFGAEAMRPHSLPLTLIGTGILWFGWFGFNAGSALAADGIAISAFVTTQIAAAVAALGLGGGRVDEDRKTHDSRGGFGSRRRLGGNHPRGRVRFADVGDRDRALGRVHLLLGGEPEVRFSYDDSLDVVGVHLVGGIVGSVVVGIFAESRINQLVSDGLLFGGAGFFVKQVVAVLAVIAFTFIVTYLLARVVKTIIGLRVDENQETEGLDISLHEERGYVLSE